MNHWVIGSSLLRSYKHINISYQKIIMMTMFILSSVFLLLWESGLGIAQEGTTVSGRLIDTTGNPISDITIYVRPYSGPNQNNSSGSDTSVQTRTDSKGGFTFSDIRHTALKLDIAGDSKIGYEINVLSAEFGEIALYPDRGWHWSSIKFALDVGTKMENIVITADIRERSKIRTRVLYADGSPVANTSIYVYRQTNPFVGGDGGDGQLINRTDVEGYFVEYLSAFEIPSHYNRLAVEHQNLYAKATPFILIDNVEIVLKLNGTPKMQNEPPLEHTLRFIALRRYLEPSPVWVVNPANGHAYKITHSQPIKDALDQAKTEGAYLVAINNEAEEKWLNYVFGNDQFWIGLSDAEEEGKWIWHSGEPVDYTNWGPYQLESGNSETKDYVKTGYFDWRWNVYGESYVSGNQKDRQPHFGRAILEKDMMQPVTLPK